MRTLQQLETQTGQQRLVIDRQQDQLVRQRTTIDADKAAGASIAQEAGGSLVDLRVGNKPEMFAGEAHEWKAIHQAYREWSVANWSEATPMARIGQGNWKRCARRRVTLEVVGE